jgi:hypothetical protein
MAAPSVIEAGKPARPRRCIPVSLRIFIGVILSLGAGSLLWFGPQAYRQYVGIRSVERDGGALGTWEPNPRIAQFMGYRVAQVFEPVNWVRYPAPGGMNQSAVTDESVACLTNFPDLQSVHIAGPRVTDRALSHLSNVSGLRSLGLGGPQFTGEGLAYLQRIPLTFFEIEDAGMTPAGYEQLSRLTRLQRLGLFGDRVTDQSLTAIRDLVDLQTLSLERTSINGRGLTNLKRLHRLEKLFLCSSPADTGLEHLAGLIKLKHLCLFDTNFDDDDIQHLSSLTNLEYLFLNRTQVCGSRFDALAGLPNLLMISLAETPTTDAALEALSRLPALNALSLQGTQITDAGLGKLERFPKLEQVWLGHTAVTDTGIAKLRRAMPSLIIKE